jgi:ABC-type polysaccharide/polyol phosphate export permease
VFGHILGAARAGGVESYPIFVVFGVLPWSYFSSTAETGAGVLLEHAPLARKIYFPWEILILAVLASRLTTLMIGCVAGLAAAALAAAIADVSFAWSRLPLILVGIVVLSAFVSGIALTTAALTPLLRDTAFLLRFGLRLAFYACPVVYPTTMVPEAYRGIYDLNPLVGMMWFFQAFASSASPPSPAAFASSFAAAAISLVGGWWVFRRLRPIVADAL